ncbi:hypothetical protein HDE78_004225 [Rhodanobacter sp. K2T2]|nr:hypothetical protein [Rhodanobacter sp. K2T2]
MRAADVFQKYLGDALKTMHASSWSPMRVFAHSDFAPSKL